MIFFVTKDKKDCNNCAGFGEFEFNPTRLEACKKCQSIHPEQYGLRYEKSENNYHFYLLNLKFIKGLFK